MMNAVWDIEPLLDPARETRAKKRGMKIASAANHRNLVLAREIAREVYLSERRPICADEVRAELERRPGLILCENYNWMGGMFKDGNWRQVGWTTSAQPGSHGNPLRTWELRREQ